MGLFRHINTKPQGRFLNQTAGEIPFWKRVHQRSLWWFGLNSHVSPTGHFGSVNSSSRFGQRSLCTLVLTEHNNKQLHPNTFPAVVAARQLNNPVCLLVAGNGCAAVAKEATKVAGVSHVCQVEDEVYGHALAEPLSDLVSSILHKVNIQGKNALEIIGSIPGPISAVVATVSAVAKDVLPCVAASHDVQPISDVTKIIDGGQMLERPTYAGNAISTIRPTDKLMILTIRATNFPSQGDFWQSSAAPLTNYKFDEIDSTDRAGLSTWVKDDFQVSDKPQLDTAKVVVSGGRAFKTEENIRTYLEPLCQKLKAALGASRAAVDAGLVSNDRQIGQTGKVVAPSLYIAVGISGAIQHVAGIKESKTIVAINKDPDAPIFEEADYGLVGDLFAILPELTEKINQQ